MGADAVTALRLVAFSALAIPLCLVLSFVDELSHSHLLLFVVAIAALVGLGFLAHYVVFGGRAQPWYLYVLSVMCFTTIVDLVLVLTIDGFVTTGDFYLKAGEPYLKLSHGSMINWWDAVVHFALYVYIIACLVRGDWRTAKPAILYYVGSIMNSLFVFLPGNVTGPYGDKITPSYLLNVPFIFMPIWLAYAALQRGAKPSTTSSTSPSRRRPSSPRHIASLPPRGDGITRTILIIGSCVSIAVLVVRAVCTVGISPNRFLREWVAAEPFLLDPSTYPRWQSITFFFYLVPYLLVAIYCLIFYSPPPAWLSDLSYLAAGGAAQGEWALVGAALHWRTDPAFHMKGTVLYDMLVAMVPHAVAAYAYARSNYSKVAQ